MESSKAMPFELPPQSMHRIMAGSKKLLILNRNSKRKEITNKSLQQESGNTTTVNNKKSRVGTLWRKLRQMIPLIVNQSKLDNHTYRKIFEGSPLKKKSNEVYTFHPGHWLPRALTLLRGASIIYILLACPLQFAFRYSLFYDSEDTIFYALISIDIFFLIRSFL